MTDPSPSPRQGPRPLPFHLMAHMTVSMASQAALPLWRSGAPDSSASAAAAALRQTVADVDPVAFQQALSDEALARSQDFLTGVSAYRRHPYRRDLSPMPVLWQQGSTRLLDYGRQGEGGAPLLVVPSLINRAYVLDLTHRRSLLRFLADHGLRPLLVDWGAPGPAESQFGLGDYVLRRLSPILDQVRRVAGPPALLGYCLGGTLALGLACLHPGKVRGLVLLAAPWDFHRPAARPAQQVAKLRPALEDALSLHHQLPADLLQLLFWSQDPGAVERKFRQFARLRPASAAARNFVALEDWANDCVPLAQQVARDLLFDWVGGNRPALGGWRLDGQAVEPAGLRLPTLLLVPRRDRIVPAEQALALARLLPNATTRLTDGGHVGMLLAPRAISQLYRVIERWLAALAKQG